jgi:hypothetical protein
MVRGAFYRRVDLIQVQKEAATDDDRIEQKRYEVKKSKAICNTEWSDEADAEAGRSMAKAIIYEIAGWARAVWSC